MSKAENTNSRNKSSIVLDLCIIGLTLAFGLAVYLIIISQNSSSRNSLEFSQPSALINFGLFFATCFVYGLLRIAISRKVAIIGWIILMVMSVVIILLPTEQSALASFMEKRQCRLKGGEWTTFQTACAGICEAEEIRCERRYPYEGCNPCGAGKCRLLSGECTQGEYVQTGFSLGDDY